MQISSLLIGVMDRELHTPPVTTSLMTEDQVAARAQSRQSVFGSELWRGSIVAEDGLGRAVSAVPTYGLPDGWLQRTALCADKIVAILKSRIGPTTFPIYECAAAQAQAVGRQLSCTSSPSLNIYTSVVYPRIVRQKK
jgi:hypothetical protein